jgi:hypothetical protein
VLYADGAKWKDSGGTEREPGRGRHGGGHEQQPGLELHVIPLVPVRPSDRHDAPDAGAASATLFDAGGRVCAVVALMC